MTELYADMCADLFHEGHVSFLQICKRMATERNLNLRVGVHSDSTMQEYKRPPTIHMQGRAAVVRACRYVDTVVENAPIEITEEFIEDNCIALVVHAHAPEEHHNYERMYRVPERLGIFARIDYTPGISTSKIIQKIRS